MSDIKPPRGTELRGYQGQWGLPKERRPLCTHVKLARAVGEYNGYGLKIKLTALERDVISTTVGDCEIVAEKYGISTGYVHQLRRIRIQKLERQLDRESSLPTDDELSQKFDDDYYGGM